MAALSGFVRLSFCTDTWSFFHGDGVNSDPPRAGGGGCRSVRLALTIQAGSRLEAASLRIAPIAQAALGAPTAVAAGLVAWSATVPP